MLERGGGKTDDILATRPNDAIDIPPAGNAEIAAIEAWVNVLPSLSSLMKLACKKQYEPTMRHIHLLIAILSDERYDSMPDIENARLMDSALFRCVCMQYRDLIPVLIDYGLLDAGIRLFPRYGVSCFLAYLARESYVAVVRLIAAEFPTRIIEVMANEPLVRNRTCYVKLAGALCQSHGFEDKLAPLAPMILEQTLTECATLRSAAFRALAIMLRHSEAISREILGTEKFEQVLEVTMEVDSMDEDLVSSIAAFFGSVMHHPGVCSKEIVMSLVAILAKMLSIVQDENKRAEILDAVGDGCPNGPEFVSCCAEVGVVSLLFAEYRSEQYSFRYKSYVIDNLISLFKAAEYQLQQSFVEAGLFDIIASDGGMLIEEVSFNIADLLSTVIQAATAHSNELWLNFIRDPRTTDLLAVLQDAEDAEVRCRARDILEEINV